MDRIDPAGSPERRHSTTASESDDYRDDLTDLDHVPSRGAEAFQEITHIRTTTSIGSSASRPPDFEVVFEDDDNYNPKQWSLWYRTWVVISISFTTWVVVFYSTAYTAAIPGLMDEFGAASPTVVTLGVTTYLLGLAAGSLLVAPASELYGRRPVYIICMACFTLLVIPCCLATSLTEIIVVRFFCAVFGSVMVSNSAGTVVDISTEEYRALVMSLWSIAPMNGPATGPLIGGFVYQNLGWRWENWLTLIFGAVGTLCMVLTKETYAPTLLQKKAARMRKEQDDDRWWCRYDEKVAPIELIKINLLRPFILAFTEPILWFFNIWISLTYGILYLCFVAYPIVFTQNRGWGPGISGLSFLGIGIGTMICICSEPLWRKIINAHPKDPETGKVPPEATARVMIIGAVSTAVGQLVFSWTCLPATIHWAIPIAAGVPFGMGNGISFIYGANYLAGSYGIYAASALAGNAVMRSFFGGTLPLAGPSMYAALTPQWAGTLLGLLEVCMIPIPIIFYKYGDRIRARSPAIKLLREDAEKNERRVARAQRSAARRQIAAQVAAEGSDEKTGIATLPASPDGGGIEKTVASVKDVERGISGADGVPPDTTVKQSDTIAVERKA
ncbi:major facilitator superfamily domain-containing protein [Microdochium trichocladiopsis]|uniref:Major facilitator superfamily domain-containing protein n=1 Tax=Microdochium trichocladiopsis TaxID=1682393 RepID=A0A9P8Y3W8_9PEZI|nr:major facilitator superfamily domain-containing protein [Microdochium trichocladiopsis]KAH7029117.1 major facilitator superfamily domain-containing protein [Microdochium trichocladiopsis]